MSLFNEKMIKYAKNIFIYFIRYRKQFIKLHGNDRDIIWIDFDEEKTILVMASFSQRDKLKRCLE